MAEKACRTCRIIVSGDVCANCKGTDLTKSWEGYILIEDPEGSEVAKAIGAKVPGKYALKLK
ncbi:MAG: DNA-directed RNA polymerase subunit E'' [Candidatus Micrarchaeota archaeon]|nr:DNA-directed RNA polymerase subunit E'' [Candidatus Micrarchaeota archaeon]